MNRFRLCSLMFCVIFTTCSISQAENSPGWRGPRGDGTSLEKNLPLKWSDTENVLWKIPIEYGGHASPVIWEDAIFLVGADTENHKRYLTRYDRRTGKKIWEWVVLETATERKHHLNSWASSTPVTDGKLIYVSFLDETKMFIAAYDFDGNLIWKKHPGIFSSRHGYCSSPIIYKDKLIVNGDHDGESYIIALDRTNGKQVWKTDRENKTRSYCTPIIRTIDGRTQLLLSGSKSICSYNPDDGKRYWIMDGPTEQFVASLIYNKGLLFVTGGFPDKHILTIDPTGKGNITKTKHIKWRKYNRGVSYVPSPVAYDDAFYIVSDNGIGTCYDARTGNVRWQKRMGRRHSASLVASAAGTIYFLDDDGITHVIKVGEKFEQIAKNELNEATYASPVVSQGNIFIRGKKHLFCIGK